jgi:26S proteasome regulatory subunit N1
MKKQLSYFLARAQVPLHWVHAPEGTEEDESGPIPEQSVEILECLGNVKLSAHFRKFGAAVGVADPKSPEDIYKTHLENTSEWLVVDSLRMN